MTATSKYQIFISSTYDDLRDERDQVIRAVLEMGHIPVGMEMFSAADQQQWQIISRHIESSDYYVVLVAHRYGSMEADRSYTEKEYDYAIECGIPVLGFVIDDAAPWPPSKSDKEQKKRNAVARFKEKVKSRYIGHWSSKADLYGKVSIALNKQMTVQPRTGWVRADRAAGPEVVAELARLSKENAELRTQLEAARRGGRSEASQAWKDFIDRIYDYSSAVRWARTIEQQFNVTPDERGKANENLDLKLSEVDKTMVKLELEFRGTEQEPFLERAHSLFQRVHKREARGGEITEFARFVGAAIRAEPAS